ncbi:hypothetical protein AB0B45_47770 [Nonomuraea sp. NPDC049152]|uniref:hypothetical protein n=1 Tax=Nonomuraea sp. NPDC049152 TaxID=3154350 RepID=UPI0033C057C2
MKDFDMPEPDSRIVRTIAAVIVGVILGALSLLPAWYAGWVSANWVSDDLVSWQRIVPITDNLADYLGSLALSLALGVGACVAVRALMGTAVRSNWLMVGAIPAAWVFSLLLVDALQVTISAPLPSSAKLWFAVTAGAFLLSAVVLFARGIRPNSPQRGVQVTAGAGLLLFAFIAAAALYQLAA